MKDGRGSTFKKDGLGFFFFKSGSGDVFVKDEFIIFVKKIDSILILLIYNIYFVFLEKDESLDYKFYFVFIRV
jgi:hypothetical protein